MKCTHHLRIGGGDYGICRHCGQEFFMASEGWTQMDDIVKRLESLRACTQKTFMHSLDWREGNEIVKAAIAEIKRLRSLSDTSGIREGKS